MHQPRIIPVHTEEDVDTKILMSNTFIKLIQQVYVKFIKHGRGSIIVFVIILKKQNEYDITPVKYETFSIYISHE